MNDFGFGAGSRGATLSTEARSYSLAADWSFSVGTPQTGLPYLWQDGLPVCRTSTKSFNVQQKIKRGLDITLVILGLLAIFPLLMVIVALIKATSPGPVLFKQTRIGRGGVPFSCYKFRTMHLHCADESGISQTKPGDSRITSVGRLLRSRSLDELPQLLNVLKGDMSLVGPRPHVPGMLAAGVSYETLVPYYPLRHAVRPGITGWAQANGLRGPTTEREAATRRVDHDLAYIQNFSLALDLRILTLTIWREFTQGTGF